MSEKVYFNTLADSKSSDTFDIEKFNRLEKGGEYRDTLQDGTVIRRISSEVDFIEFETPPPPSILRVSRSFHLNGNLKMKGMSYRSDEDLGIWREYDEQGNLIKEENYDEGYDYSFEDVVKFLRIRGVDLFGKYTSIRRNDGVWEVSYVKGNGYPKYFHVFSIDGKTGEVLSSDKNEFVIE